METKLKTRTQRINFFVDNLKKRQPDDLERSLKMMYLKSLAKKLDSTVLENNVTMKEIVEEVNSARKERYEKNRI